MAKIPLLGLGIGYNAYGHSVVRYTMPSGEQKVMNIVGGNRGNLVQFSSPKNYFFSTKYRPKSGETKTVQETHLAAGEEEEDAFEGGEQRGLYNRAMVSVRIEDLPAEKLIAMDDYYVQLASKAKMDQSRFNIAFDPIFNALGTIFPLAERGNCARYTSEGLVAAGVSTNVSMWPKSIWVNMFENAYRTSAGSHDNVNVVSYRRVKHAVLSYGTDGDAPEAVAPLQSLRSLAYWNLERFANVIVEVPEGSTKATVTVQANPLGPSRLRNHTLNNNWFIACSCVVTFVLISRFSRRFNNRVLYPAMLGEKDTMKSLQRWERFKKMADARFKRGSSKDGKD